MSSYFTLSLQLCVCLVLFVNQHPAKAEAQQADTEATQNIALYEAQAKQKISKFGKELKQTLVSTIKSEGYVAAVEVCKTQAPNIAKALSTDGWQVGRTSKKVRNISNLPDEWEAKMLAVFDADFKAGAKPQGLSASTHENGKFRFMKAIPTGQVCLACHGDKVDPDLLKAIQSNYPEDLATGFTLQDIRGAFTVSYDLPSE